MRIFYAVPASPHASKLPFSRVWHNNLYLPLKDLGHEVVEFKFDYNPFNLHLNPTVEEHKTFITKNRPVLSAELLKQLKRAHHKKPINLFLSYFYSSYVYPEAIKEIGKLGITTVNWYCNGSYQFNLVSEIAPAYDYCLVPEKFRLKDYKNSGAHPIYCQEAANPNFYKPYPLTKNYDVTFVGQKYGNRPSYIKALVDAGQQVKVWGPHWRDSERKLTFKEQVHNLLLNKKVESITLPGEICGGTLSDLDVVKMYSRSKITLGFTKLWKSIPGEVDKQVRLRDFEATMSGAFYLVEQFDELEDFFRPGKELETFRSEAELVSKVKFYLKNDAAREKIRRACLARALKDHTWQKRLKDSFNKMKLT